jgi:hypothetical protein
MLPVQRVLLACLPDQSGTGYCGSVLSVEAHTKMWENVFKPYYDQGYYDHDEPSNPCVNPIGCTCTSMAKDLALLAGAPHFALGSHFCGDTPRDLRRLFPSPPCSSPGCFNSSFLTIEETAMEREIQCAPPTPRPTTSPTLPSCVVSCKAAWDGEVPTVASFCAQLEAWGMVPGSDGSAKCRVSKEESFAGCSNDEVNTILGAGPMCASGESQDLEQCLSRCSVGDAFTSLLQNHCSPHEILQLLWGGVLTKEGQCSHARICAVHAQLAHTSSSEDDVVCLADCSENLSNILPLCSELWPHYYSGAPPECLLDCVSPKEWAATDLYMNVNTLPLETCAWIVDIAGQSCADDCDVEGKASVEFYLAERGCSGFGGDSSNSGGSGQEDGDRSDLMEFDSGDAYDDDLVLVVSSSVPLRSFSCVVCHISWMLLLCDWYK